MKAMTPRQRALLAKSFHLGVIASPALKSCRACFSTTALWVLILSHPLASTTLPVSAAYRPSREFARDGSIAVPPPPPASSSFDRQLLDRLPLAEAAFL